MTRLPDIKKVLVIGSGPIIIGQAAEFDYAGTQACRALREEGITSVLVNSNPATIMTDEGVADITYIEPLTVEALERIIARERPDGLLATLGGQTGLNLAIALADAGVLERHNVRLLGTQLETIRQAEDREEFKRLLQRIGEPVPPSLTVTTLADARAFAESNGYPVVIRPAFTLGGTGGGIAFTPAELERVVSGGLAASPIHQVLIEQYLKGWKELEYEVIRDSADTCIVVCNMENIDPMGIHTGDSIVVAPSQTLSDKDYQMLRDAAIHIIRSLGIEGGCNVQFALDPLSAQYHVIEVNPRVSRSSALASKATGYPIARVATKIAIGRRLEEIPNPITGQTSAAFEPALDYVVVKIPRWPFDKFPAAERRLGTQMKATGEVMAIDRCFEAALQKAIRSLELGSSSFWEQSGVDQAECDFTHTLAPTDTRLWQIINLLRRDPSDAMLQKLQEETGIDIFFLYKLRNLVLMETRLKTEAVSEGLLRAAKRLGFSDKQIASCAGTSADAMRSLRQKWGIRPVFKMVDTCAAEFEAQTPYFYSTYEQENEAAPLGSQSALVLGSGPIRIGQGIEFDYCSVRSATTLHETGIQSILVNSNPETVSTDFDLSDRLYFEPLDEESVLAVLENEGQPGTIAQFGGQTAINLAAPLARQQIDILGTSVEAIDLAEDRRRFDDLLEHLRIPRPQGSAVTTKADAMTAAERIGYPVVVRPSYVLGGRAMEIVYTAAELERYVSQAVAHYGERPILIDRYLKGKEVEVDAICDGTEVFIPGIMEHIERAGVHSGDSIAVYPARRLSDAEIATIVDYTTHIALALNIRGLMNAQFVITELSGNEDNHSSAQSAPNVFVLEVNPRSSRTVPFLSKATGVPMVTLATRIMLGSSLQQEGYGGGLHPNQPLVAIKAPVFSMGKLPGAETALGPEMKSTGEVMGIDYTYHAALTKALIAAGARLPETGAALISIADRDKAEALPIVQGLATCGYSLYATAGTAQFLKQHGLQAEVVGKISEGDTSIPTLIVQRQVNVVMNTLSGGPSRIREGREIQDGFEIRRAAAENQIPCFTSLDTARAVVDVLQRQEAYAILPFGTYRSSAEPVSR
ncbi:MAG TPA: carbamoyl-phosphate synthase large subunit [Ktedonobacterales bacterium]|nr:carbamoyl-phosphate synthase large subunit [Ktedonobacterales bacterium]